MWFLIVLIILIVIVVLVVRNNNQTTTGQMKSVENVESRGIITEEDKEQLLAKEGNNLLTFTMNQYQQAISGNTDSMVAMGAIYQSKLNNGYKAAYWYEIAHRAGNSEGTYWLGECYRSGYGVEESGPFGMGLILDAARHGNVTAIEFFKDRGMTEDEMKQYGIPLI